MIKVNGVALPCPSEYDTGIMDISKADRNAKGTIIIERVATKRKLEMKWKYMLPEDLKQVLNLVSPVTFMVEYLDPQTGKMETKRMYVGDRKMSMYSYIANVPVWVNVGFNFIEV